MHEEQSRRRDDIAIQIMSERVNTIHSDILDLKSSIKESVSAFNEAVTKLIRMEERQAQMISASEQTQKLIKDLESRVDALEKEVPMQQQIKKWALTAVWSLATGAVYTALKFVGIL